ncbi:MAG: hypothetical protein HY927_01035 [Elusimicrobia bacterium]|nr:hypothetical protein [Elusimicrobiota bacterium]
MAQACCVDCRWCELRISLDAGSNYYCVVLGESLKGDVLWRAACKDYSLPASPAQKPAERPPTR